jgi:hypothetical protein
LKDLPLLPVEPDDLLTRPPLELAGTQYEMGVVQGRRLGLEMHRMLESYFELFDILGARPRWVPRTLFRRVIFNLASRMIGTTIEDRFPEQWDFVRGIAAGSNLPLPVITFFQAIDCLGDQVMGYKNVPGALDRALATPPEAGQTGGSDAQLLGGCSAVGVSDALTTAGGPLIAKNWDGAHQQAPYNLLRVTRPTDRHAIVGTAVGGLAGCNNGVNAAGLAVAYQYAFERKVTGPGAPYMILIKEGLETCATVREFIKFLEQAPRVGGATLVVADAAGDLRVIEAARSAVRVRSPGNESFVVATNHFLDPDMCALEVPRDAVYVRTKVPGQRGTPVHLSSYARARDARNLLGMTNAPTGEHALYHQILCSHGQNGEPSPLTLCNHGPLVGTGFGLVLNPRERTAWIGLGSPCGTPPTRYAL